MSHRMIKTFRPAIVAFFAALLLAGLATSAPGKEKPAKKGKSADKLLVVINGESNSGGYALNSEATAAELAPRPAVLILNNETLKAFEPLDIGTNNLLGHTGLAPSDTHGFELMLAERAERAPAKNQPVYLVKTGHGGSTIAQWAPDGAYFQTFLKRIAAAKELLKEEEVRPVVLFSLGINDAIAGTKLEVWKPGVIVHFENLRKALGAETPIVMTRFMPNYAAYNAAIEEICQTVPHTYSVNTLDAPLRDPNHWNYAGMKLVTGRMLDVLDGLDKKSKSKSKPKSKPAKGN
jgi:lysophospholipase L1-like esterase